MSTLDIDRIFEKAQKSLSDYDFKEWLCFAFGVMKSRHDAGTKQLLVDHLNQRSSLTIYFREAQRIRIQKAISELPSNAFADMETRWLDKHPDYEGFYRIIFYNEKQKCDFLALKIHQIL